MRLTIPWQRLKRKLKGKKNTNLFRKRDETKGKPKTYRINKTYTNGYREISFGPINNE